MKSITATVLESALAEKMTDHLGPAKHRAPEGGAGNISIYIGWPLEVIDDVGHAPHMERPGAFLEGLQALGMAEL